jgi:uncharacterized lipoprotein YddW (UPF0748 family)
MLLVAAVLAFLPNDTTPPPPIDREFRGVWVASVSNIDWPSRRDLSTAEQQRELLAILDRAVDLRLNAVVLQVRPAADAIYQSSIEPWSEFLTGKMGRAPEPFYDPLAFAVTEAHRRGLELHAWLNPYRVKHPGETSPVSPQHISRRRPDLVRRYGPYLWLDPGSAEVRAYTSRVVVDIVKRYDIDAIHIDDYFYPYREPGRRGRGYLQFPDDRTYRTYRRGGGKLSRDDWRRRNVDLLVEALYKAVKQTKSWVKFGVSPFGIWRPGYPESVRGLDSYQEIFADSRKWLTNGWLDYFSPQLYWRVDAPEQRYTELLRWWVDQNTHGRHIWPGLYTSRVGGDGSVIWPASEVVNQVRLTREQAGATGNVHFSMASFFRNSDSLADRLTADLYMRPALIPASPWLDRTKPQPPVARFRPDSVTGNTTVTLRPAGKEPVWLWVVQARYGTEWTTRIVPGSTRDVVLTQADASAVPDRVVVRAIDRVGVESEPVDAGIGTN